MERPPAVLPPAPPQKVLSRADPMWVGNNPFELLVEEVSRDNIKIPSDIGKDISSLYKNKQNTKIPKDRSTINKRSKFTESLSKGISLFELNEPRPETLEKLNLSYTKRYPQGMLLPERACAAVQLGAKYVKTNVRLTGVIMNTRVSISGQKKSSRGGDVLVDDSTSGRRWYNQITNSYNEIKAFLPTYKTGEDIKALYKCKSSIDKIVTGFSAGCRKRLKNLISSKLRKIKTLKPFEYRSNDGNTVDYRSFRDSLHPIGVRGTALGAVGYTPRR